MTLTKAQWIVYLYFGSSASVCGYLTYYRIDFNNEKGVKVLQESVQNNGETPCVCCECLRVAKCFEEQKKRLWKFGKWDYLRGSWFKSNHVKSIIVQHKSVQMKTFYSTLRIDFGIDHWLDVLLTRAAAELTMRKPTGFREKSLSSRRQIMGRQVEAAVHPLKTEWGEWIFFSSTDKSSPEVFWWNILTLKHMWRVPGLRIKQKALRNCPTTHRTSHEHVLNMLNMI